MANPQIEQFTQALFWKAVPWILLASAIGTFGGLALKWLERRATRFGRELRNRREATAENRRSQTAATTEAPRCPECNALMVKRAAKRGAHAGSAFWGCTNYPKCRGTREV